MVSVLVYACLLSVGSLPCSLGYSRGAPRHACRELKPMHGPDPQDLTTTPYYMTVDYDQSNEADTFIVKVQLSGSRDFKGFVIQARNNSRPVGQFINLPENTATLRCGSDYPESAVTHTNPDLKQNIELLWRAPDGFKEQVTFKSSFVENFDTFWVDHEAKIRPKPMEPTETIKPTEIMEPKESMEPTEIMEPNESMEPTEIMEPMTHVTDSCQQNRAGLLWTVCLLILSVMM